MRVPNEMNSCLRFQRNEPHKIHTALNETVARDYRLSYTPNRTHTHMLVMVRAPQNALAHWKRVTIKSLYYLYNVLMKPMQHTKRYASAHAHAHVR